MQDTYVVAGVDGKDARDYDESNLRKAKRALEHAQQQKGQMQP